MNHHWRAEFVSCLNEVRQIIVDGVIGHACERNAFAIAHLAPGEHDLTHLTDQTRIVVKCFIKVPETKKDNGFRELLFDFEILAANQGNGWQ